MTDRLVAGPVTLDGTHRRRDGTTFPVEVRLGLIQSQKHPLILALARDVSDRRRAEQILRERSHLREAVASMEHVLGVVSHELRTPLASVRIMSELLLAQSSTDPALGDLLAKIHAQTIQMSDTVDNLLEAARLNSGKARWNWTTFTLKSAVEDALESIRPLVDASRVELSSSVDPPGAAMQGDADAVRRLLLNLLANAVRHTHQGSVQVIARVDHDGQTNWVRLEVRDTGPGIPPHVLERLCEAFTLNVGAVGAANVSGAGLGLSICRAIVTAHGGAMKINSTVGQGAVVSIRLRQNLPGAIGAVGPAELDSVNDSSREAA